MTLSRGHPAGEVQLRYRRADGGFADTTLERVVVDDLVAGLPVREFRWYKGRRHYSGWYWLTRIGVHSTYAAAVLGPLLATGAGFRFTIATAINTGTFGVAPQDAGVALATVNTGSRSVLRGPVARITVIR